MIHRHGQGGIFDIITDNAVVHEFFMFHTENINELLAKAKESIRDDHTLIILNGMCHNINETEHWIAPINEFYANTANPLLVLNGRLTTDNPTVQPIFTYGRLSIFDYLSNIYWDECKQINPSILNLSSSRVHKFYWASSKDWYTRRYVLAKLIENNLLENNLVNYKCLSTNISTDKDYSIGSMYSPKIQKQIINACNSIQHLLPLPPIDNTVDFQNTPVDFYCNSYLGIITDTSYESNIYLSEKIFNAINYEQLFAYLGPPYTLAYLKDQGYETFGDVIDETYDNNANHGERLLHYTTSLIDFLSQPIDTIHDVYVTCLPRIKHNKQLLQSQRPDLKFTEFVRQALARN